ncbi:DUF4252 domain-containing protein [Costertonia aggregata]|uniref:DUF4252 domain-containing protein n=1 Tax=Costertonia aggregata TaxID=343403 RepID=A0A7H9AKN8_9FLAO|nr:DUF4252 domain-containing protein [Costertonia aggregata]QLG43913.1 DUF4252 domain-containing protein [Costertonia aggregata]
MKKYTTSIIIVVILLLSSCSSTQSLQEYYVDNQENPNFISLDVPASILNLEETNLTDVQKEAIGSLKKLNILAFKKSQENVAEFKVEQANVKKILKNDKFVELMKLNSSYGKGVIKYLGDEDAIDEVIVYGSSDEKGFMLIRVLGDNMNPAHLVQLMNALQKSDYKGEGLGELGDFLKG